MRSSLRGLVAFLVLPACAAEPAPAPVIVPAAPVVEIKPPEPPLPPEPEGFELLLARAAVGCDLDRQDKTLVGIRGPGKDVKIGSFSGSVRLRLTAEGTEAWLETGEVSLRARAASAPSVYLKRPFVARGYYVPSQIGHPWTMKDGQLAIGLKAFAEWSEPVACADVASVSSRFRPEESAPVARGKAKLVGRSGAPLALTPGGPEIVRIPEKTAVDVAEVKGADTLVVGRVHLGTFFGWVPSRSLLPVPPPKPLLLGKLTGKDFADLFAPCAIGAPDCSGLGSARPFEGQAVGSGRAASSDSAPDEPPPRTTLACPHDVRLLAIHGEQRFVLGAVKAHTSLRVIGEEERVTEVDGKRFAGFAPTRASLRENAPRFVVPNRDLTTCVRNVTR